MCKGRTMMNEIMWSNVIAVTNRRLSARPYLEQIERICIRHPRAVLIREKDLTREDYAHLAARVYDICRSHHVPCIYHSFIDEACSAGAEMIHLPLHLLRKYAGRPILTEFGKIGTSVHSREEAEEAAALGASYMTAGHIFATDCKKGLPPRGLPFLRSVCEVAEIPVYAIGGIHTEEQAEEAMAAGAAGVCVMSEAMQI